MRIFKSHPLLKLVNSYLIDSPQPSNISYLWNFGSLLAVCLVIQIITGVTLAMHYNPSVLEAFNSVEHIMRDVNNGWLIRYLHSNTASAFFFLVYLHIGRGLYYGSYRAPRTLVWTLGTIIFLLMMATGFLGYVLPYGQMSLWGATVITNLMSAIPWIGQDIVEFLWGGFSVNNATLNRFFALHFVLPFVLAALALMHLIALHDSAGSGNPLGVSGNYDRLPMAPYFLFKDLITIFLFIIVLSILVFFMPNVLGDSENYVMANPMQTPPAIVPEWYLLPFYAILRSIPNKLLGVIAMFSAILALLVMPFTDLSRSRGIQFKPLSKMAFYIFVANFLILMVLGAKHVESPFIEFGQISTVIYFAHFLIIVPLVSIIENSLMDLNSINNKVKNNIVLAGFSLPILILITIGTVSGELSITIVSNFDVTGIVDTTIKTAIDCGSSFFTTGLDLCLKSVPFMCEKTLDLIISPVRMENPDFIGPSLSSLSNTLQQINNLNVQLANLLTEYIRLNAISDSPDDFIDLCLQMTAVRENIAQLLANFKVLLESLGATFNQLPNIGQPLQIVDIADIRVPNIPARVFNLNFLGNDQAWAVVRDGFNVLESEFATLLQISLTFFSGYDWVF
jgi:ubiquinol-cytochrome c reductase cytochrome b subunit